MTKIEKLFASKQRVFTVNDLAVLWQIPERPRLWSLIRHYLRQQRLIRVYSGIYVLQTEYSELELAVKLFAPAYVSYVTALGLHGINFQYYRSIHVMAKVSKTIDTYDGHRFVAHQLKDELLFNDVGLHKEQGYTVASPERTVCDTLYLHKRYYFDSLHSVDPERLLAVAQIYRSQSLQREVEKLINLIKKGEV